MKQLTIRKKIEENIYLVFLHFCFLAVLSVKSGTLYILGNYFTAPAYHYTHTHTYTTYTVLSVRFFTGKPKHLLQLHSILFLLVMNFSNELISTLEKDLKGIRNLSQYSACVNNQFSFYQFSSRVKVSVCEATEPGEEYAFMTEYTRYQQITAHEGLCI